MAKDILDILKSPRLRTIGNFVNPLALGKLVLASRQVALEVKARSDAGKLPRFYPRDISSENIGAMGRTAEQLILQLRMPRDEAFDIACLWHLSPTEAIGIRAAELYEKAGQRGSVAVDMAYELATTRFEELAAAEADPIPTDPPSRLLPVLRSLPRALGDDRMGAGESAPSPNLPARRQDPRLAVRSSTLLRYPGLTVRNRIHGLIHYWRDPWVEGRVRSFDYYVTAGDQDISTRAGCAHALESVHGLIRSGEGTENHRNWLLDLERLQQLVERADPPPSDPGERLALEVELKKLLVKLKREKNGWLYGAVERVLQRRVQGMSEADVFVRNMSRNVELQLGGALLRTVLFAAVLGAEELWRNQPGIFSETVRTLRSERAGRTLTMAETDLYEVCLRLGSVSCATAKDDPAARTRMAEELRGTPYDWFFVETRRRAMRELGRAHDSEPAKD
ncbi:MAG: hypothetical protein ACKVPX_09725 [Myxococcaceae bacterium]